MLKLIDLARRSDFQAGPLLISPSRRLIEGPVGRANVPPIVMKIFLLLLDAQGSVVTRDELFGTARGGVFVGDDSLNGAIARVRKIAAETAPGLFEIQTIPRTGYRLTGDIPMHRVITEVGAAPTMLMTRRVVLGSSAAAAMMGAGALSWWHRMRSNERFDALIAGGEKDLSNRSTFPGMTTVERLREAARLRPVSAKAWGMLALAQSFAVQASLSGNAEQTVANAQEAAEKALAIEPKEPNALLAMYELEGSGLDWFTRDRRLREIVAAAPGNIPAISELDAALQAAGLTREAWDWNERALVINPLLPDLWCRRAMKLWILGRNADADKVIDRARELWPSNRFVTWVRFQLLATTARAAAAEMLLDANPNFLPPPSLPMWRSALRAFKDPSSANLSNSGAACVKAAQSAAILAAQAVMICGALHQTDLAFQICNGFLLWQGKTVRTGLNELSHLGSDAQWRAGTQWLFSPPCAPLRADPRFAPLCKDIGLEVPALRCSR